MDFEKAYDLVEWDYLELVMAKMGFPEKWRKWILECVGSVSVYMLVDESPTKEFAMRRGLRHDDPLSSFLFLIASEGLSVLFSVYVEANRFKGFKVDSNEFRVSLLQFVDDTLIMREKCWDNIRAIKVRGWRRQNSLPTSPVAMPIEEEWYDKKLFKIIGNESNTLFWKDPWLVGGVLREKFSRLFHLSLQEEENVEVMLEMLQ
ncbi:uncharacterized protein [Cicer arietinum]|uniref:uncharacterized protein n=1 Tax=Cicer arietinum TaxID=3827 RepID=UPI003CC65D46